MTDGNKGVGVPLRLRPNRAETIIREAAQDTRKVILSDHAKERMEEREISDLEVFRILRTGHVMDEPMRTRRKEWKCKVVKNVKGGRDIGVITVIMNNGLLFVKTVEWED
ncbi:MAG TPA: DUF4258 domain-containing protein [Stellaceae bacterium]|nr:DUF4258 domain-containing protein [Stellaceae bacterium]